jgi:hypothetical protein
MLVQFIVCQHKVNANRQPLCCFTDLGKFTSENAMKATLLFVLVLARLVALLPQYSSRLFENGPFQGSTSSLCRLALNGFTETPYFAVSSWVSKAQG